MKTDKNTPEQALYELFQAINLEIDRLSTSHIYFLTGVHMRKETFDILAGSNTNRHSFDFSHYEHFMFRFKTPPIHSGIHSSRYRAFIIIDQSVDFSKVVIRHYKEQSNG